MLLAFRVAVTALAYYTGNVTQRKSRLAENFWTQVVLHGIRLLQRCLVGTGVVMWLA